MPIQTCWSTASLVIVNGQIDIGLLLLSINGVIPLTIPSSDQQDQQGRVSENEEQEENSDQEV